MDLGVTIFPTDESVGVVEFAKATEELGFESLFFPEHTHIPAGRETPYPPGGELPREYSRIIDPFVALAAAAGVTETLKLGTGLAILVERDPIMTAKQAASLDYVSGGRFLCGVGAGWNLEEMRNHGTDPERRFGILRESVEAMKAIWTSEEASYHGKYVDFERIWAWPKPLQKPHPPVLLGGNGKQVYNRVVAYADEWMPNWLGSTEKLAGRVRSLQKVAAEAGRGQIPVTAFGIPPVAEDIEMLAEAGVTRGLFHFWPAGREEIFDRLERRAALAHEYASAGG